MTFADVGNGLAMFVPEIPGLLATLAVLAYRTSRALTGAAEVPVSTERIHTT